MAPRKLFEDDGPELIPDSEYDWMKAFARPHERADRRHQEKHRGTKEKTSVEKIIGGHQPDTAKKPNTLERKVEESDIKHCKAIETIEQTFTRHELGETRRGKDKGESRSTAAASKAKDAPGHDRRAGVKVAMSATTGMGQLWAFLDNVEDRRDRRGLLVAARGEQFSEPLHGLLVLSAIIGLSVPVPGQSSRSHQNKERPTQKHTRAHI